MKDNTSSDDLEHGAYRLPFPSLEVPRGILSSFTTTKESIKDRDLDSWLRLPYSSEKFRKTK